MKKSVAIAALFVASLTVPGCASIEAQPETVEVVTCDDSANPDCAPDREIEVIDE